MHNFTDAERSFADSAEGQCAIAHEKMKHRNREAYKGAGATPWTDAIEATAIRRLTTERARQVVKSAAFLADHARQLPALEAAAVTARELASQRMRDAHRGGL